MLKIKLCTEDDIDELTILNQQLIEDEKSDNQMTVDNILARLLLNCFWRNSGHAELIWKYCQGIQRV